MESEHEEDASGNNPVDQKTDFQRYCEEESNEAYATMVKGQEEYDKQLLILSTGILAVLIAFLKDVVHLDTATYKALLYCGFAGFGLTIILVITSFQVSIYVLELVREYWKQQFKGNTDHPFPDSTAKKVKYTNWAGGVTFVGGVISVFLFITLNLTHQSASGVLCSNEQPIKLQAAGVAAKTEKEDDSHGRNNSEETNPCPKGEHCIYKHFQYEEIGIPKGNVAMRVDVPKPQPHTIPPIHPGLPAKPPIHDCKCVR
jgi:hypothetical protein